MRLVVALLAGTLMLGLVDPALGQQPSEMEAGGAGSDAAVMQSPSAKERHKLDLEVKKLETETGEWAQLRAWLPAGTVLIGVIAAALSIFQYFGEQRFKTSVRLEEQFDESLEAISDYPETGHSTSARVVRALRSLAELAPLSANPYDHIRDVTHVIAVAVQHDVNFEDLHQSRFDGLCLAGWPDYGRWLDEHSQERRFILYRYQQAFRTLANRHDQYFRTMTLGERGYVVDQFIPEHDYLHFTALANGYRRQVKRLTDSGERDDATSALGDALGNPQLAQAMLDRTT